VTGYPASGDFSGSPNVHLLLATSYPDRVRPVAGLAYWRFQGTIHGAIEESDYPATTHAVVLSGGFRYLLGAVDPGSRSPYFEWAPALVYLDHRARPEGSGTVSESRRGLLLGFRAAAILPLAVRGTRRYEVGVNYLWTEDFRVRRDGYWSSRRHGLSQAGLILGLTTGLAAE
jgi:hypothetical protein